MARVVALVPDLLFGSKVQGMLARRGPRGRMATLDAAARSGCRGRRRRRSDRGRPGLDGIVGAVPSLAFYSHVDADVRARAEQAGYDLVVPRSRMAREGADLVGRLVR